MRIFTPCWGKKHIHLLENALGKSFLWPKNAEVLKGCVWSITTSNEDEAQEIGKILGKITPECRGEVLIIPELSNPSVDSGMVLIEALRRTIYACMEERTPMLMATPDFIYGDGTLKAFQTIAKEEGTCASIAHIRVLPEIIQKLDVAPFNEELVSLAFKYPHISWSDSDNRLYKSGLRKWKLDESTYAVQHFMPSPFYCNFLREDLDHFTNHYDNGRPPAFGCFDHTWPTRLLEEGRLRFIGSSEAAVMVEITDPDKNVPPLNEATDPEHEFFHSKFHNKIFKQVISTFRGE